MNARERAALWSRLSARGLVRGAVPAPAADAGVWYIRAMIGIAAWIAALFLLAFIGLGVHDLLRTSGAKIVAGILSCGGAAAILRLARGAFVAQLGLALSLTGQGLFALGVLGWFRSRGMPGATETLLIAAFEALLVVVVPHFVHRVICAAAAAFAFSYALGAAGLGTLGLPVLAAAFVAVELDDARAARFPISWPAIGIGLALALIAVLPVQLAPDDWRQGWLPRQAEPLLGPRFADVAMGVVFFGAAKWLVARSQIERRGVGYAGTLAGALALSVASVWVPGLAAALLIVFAGFATAQRPLMGLGMVALLAALSRYYYTLAATLLVKSAALLATAAVLFALWYALRRTARDPSEHRHA
jgi:hypothetical protein